MHHDDAPNPYEPPAGRSVDGGSSGTEPARRIRLCLLLATLCGVLGGVGVFGTIVGGIGIARAAAQHGWGPVLAHPLIATWLFMGGASLAWLASALAWLRWRWWIATILTALAIGLLSGVKSSHDAYRHRSSMEVRERVAPGPVP